MDTKIKYIIVAAILAVVAALLGWRILQSRKAAPLPKTVGEQIFEQVKNPVKGTLPESNPFKKVETNPFKSAPTPFGGVYKNPF